MTMCLVVLGAETGNDNVRLPFPDRPDDISQNFFTVPNAECFGSALRKTEIDGAGEELPGVIGFPRREELVGADKTETLAQFGPNQVLAAVSARDGEIGGVVERAVGPERHQVGVLIVRMRGDIENTPEDVELLEPELDFGGIHRCWKHRRRRLSCT